MPRDVKKIRKNRGLFSILTPLAILLMMMLFPAAAYADDDHLGQWTERYRGNWLNGICYGNGQYVVVGNGGLILTSPDGANWTPRKSFTTNNLNAVCYGGSPGQYVAVGNNSTVLTSRDGILWVPMYSMNSRYATQKKLVGVAYGNNKFIAIANEGDRYLRAFADGTQWEEGSIANNSQKLYGLCYRETGYLAGKYISSSFIAVGANSTILKFNGNQWSAAAKSGSFSVPLNTVCYGGDKAVAAGNGLASFEWGQQAEWIITKQGLVYGTNNLPIYLNSVCYGSGMYVALDNNGKVVISTDGETWTLRAPTNTWQPRGICYNGKTFVTVGTNIMQNDATPNDISITTASVAENSPAGTTVGTLSGIDSDVGETFTYSLVSGPGNADNSSFTLSGDTLKLAVKPDYETKNCYSIRVRAADYHGLSFEKVFNITITDVNELHSITNPADIAGLANGTAKTAEALLLPSFVVIETDFGKVNADVIWNTGACSYDPASASVQTFTVSGSVVLPAGIENTNNVSLSASIAVTVNAPQPPKVLQSIKTPAPVTGLPNKTPKTAAALGLPANVLLATDLGDASASVAWAVYASPYKPDSTIEQIFAINGDVTLPAGVVNTLGLPLSTAVNVTVKGDSSTKVMQSITAPVSITGVANGTAKTSAALGLPSTMTIITDKGSVNTGVVWAVDACGYDPAIKSGQTFTIEGTVALPGDIVNTGGIPLTVSISVTVADSPTDKILQSITAPTALTSVTNGTAKTAEALGLPSTVTVVTDQGEVSADVAWAVDAAAYNPVTTTAQTFSVSGTVTLPSGVANTNNIALTTSISVTVNAAAINSSSSSGGYTPSSSAPASTYTASIIENGTKQSTMPIITDAENAKVNLGIQSESYWADGAKSVINVPSIPGVKSYTMETPTASLSGAQGNGSLTVSTAIGSITIPNTMLAGNSELKSKNASITIAQGDRSSLSNEAAAAIDNRPLLQLTLKVDGVQTEWNHPGAPVIITIPYTPTAKELVDPENIVVYYIDGSGKLASVPSGRYNPAAGAVTFTTTHFSQYAIAYVHKTFGDLRNAEWARKSIEVMASKGIINGTGANIYSPSANITRADYLVMLVKTLGLTASFDINFEDKKPGAYYYQSIGIGKKLGIASGTGNNHFNPQENISRQDMIVLTANALSKLKEMQAVEDTNVLDRFNDKADIAGYAAKSMATLVTEGLISGQGDKLNPGSRATRAEAAVFLYKIYNKI